MWFELGSYFDSASPTTRWYQFSCPSNDFNHTLYIGGRLDNTTNGLAEPLQQDYDLRVVAI